VYGGTGPVFTQGLRCSGDRGGGADLPAGKREWRRFSFHHRQWACRRCNLGTGRWISSLLCDGAVVAMAILNLERGPETRNFLFGGWPNGSMGRGDLPQPIFRTDNVELVAAACRLLTGSRFVSMNAGVGPDFASSGTGTTQRRAAMRCALKRGCVATLVVPGASVRTAR